MMRSLRSYSVSWRHGSIKNVEAPTQPSYALSPLPPVFLLSLLMCVMLSSNGLFLGQDLQGELGVDCPRCCRLVRQGGLLSAEATVEGLKEEVGRLQADNILEDSQIHRLIDQVGELDGRMRRGQELINK